MVNHSCEKCGKTFTQKRYYENHLRRKIPCDSKNIGIISNNGDNNNMDTIDELLQKFTKSDVFTPDKISEIMSSYLHNEGDVLEPSVGDGQLLKYINIDNYEHIDIYDIKKEYLDRCPSNNNVNKYHEDFITKEIIKKYRNIILNPPYIKIQDLSEQYRDYIRKKWKILDKGNIDIYYAFILKCIDLLDDNGIMVAITPNSYLYNKGSLRLRKYLLDNKLIKRIIDYKSEKVFDKVSTYCCITIFTKENKDSLVYNDETIQYSDITNKEYNIFSTGGKYGTKSLNDICNIRNGIATLRDKIYIHKSRIYDEPCWKVITSGDKDMWCIFPYNDKAEVLNEDYFKNNNPLTYEYLKNHKGELAKRDKGNKIYPQWYSYGRTQSLKISKKDKIMYIPTFADPENIIYKIDSPKLCIGCLSLEMKDDGYTIEQVKEYLENNKDFIIQNSSKRGGGWLNMSSRILKQIEIE